MTIKERILCVDDDQVVLFSLTKDLQTAFTVTTAQSGAQALELLQNQGPFAVILADMLMPGMNGVEFLAQAQQRAPDTVRIMLTADEDRHTAANAVNEGQIFRFLTKPCPPEKLIPTIQAGVRQYRLVVAEKELLEKTLNGSVDMLTELLAAAEPEAFGRGQKIRDLVKAVAPVAGLESSWDIEIASLLAQVGLVTIPPTILQKRRQGLAMQIVEKQMLERVPEIGSKLLGKIPRLAPAANIVLFQRKGFDGSGFPASGEVGQSIPIGARLLRVVSDLFDAELQGTPRQKAFDELCRNSRIYDPKILEAVKKALVESPVSKEGHVIRLKDLQPGYELTEKLETKDGMLIAPAGTKISETMLERIHNFAELVGIREPIHVRIDFK